jgi:hypothetical protein
MRPTGRYGRETGRREKGGRIIQSMREEEGKRGAEVAGSWNMRSARRRRKVYSQQSDKGGGGWARPRNAGIG